MAKKDGKKLVIVESPAKAKTINKYLGSDYIVKASMGHVRDLPEKGMGVDLRSFTPEYQILPSRHKVVSELRRLAKESSEVYLATDLDREGEAIAWHLKETLGVPDEKARRVIFNAITRSEVQKAFASPQSIDIDRVNAQQARRILDRIVGYEISPLLWKKVARGLSAGRVQSVAVRLIVEREREIEAFVPEEFWKITGVFTVDGARAAQLAEAWKQFLGSGNGERTRVERQRWLNEHSAFTAELVEIGGVKFTAGDRDAARRAAEAVGFVVERVETFEDPEGKGPARNICRIVGRLAPPEKLPPLVVRSVETRPQLIRPPAPFITSTMQQAASSRLGFGAQRTMRLAQNLYEAGHITYMRTDSTDLSAEAIDMVRKHIRDTFGEQYLPARPNVFASSNKSAQEAHEAIHPTDMSFSPEQARKVLGADEYRLYQLIYDRFVACQMPPAQFEQTVATIECRSGAGLAVFRATGRKLVFDGFMRVLGMSGDDPLLPAMKEGQRVFPLEMEPSQHFTQPPPRFTEATLVKELERLGIGRPSTYATIIQTIQDRGYVKQRERRFYPTMLGCIVTDKLVQAFPNIMDVKFTADMELKLDQIEEKHLDWIRLLREFYGPFHREVEAALDKLSHAGGTLSPYKCEKCGQPMVYRISRNGFFLACSNRECGATMPVDDTGKPVARATVSQYKCPNCGRDMVRRKGRYGEFLGCSGYAEKDANGKPLCSTIINLDKQGNPLPPRAKPVQTQIKCEKCGGVMLLRDSKRGPFLGCAAFPRCRSIKSIKKLPPEQFKQIEPLLAQLKSGASAAQAACPQPPQEHAAAKPEAPAGPIPTDIDCEECGRPMVIRMGRRGRFLGCSGYPKCRNTAEVPAKLLEEMGLNGNGVKTPTEAATPRADDAECES